MQLNLNPYQVNAYDNEGKFIETVDEFGFLEDAENLLQQLEEGRDKSNPIWYYIE